MRETSKPGTVRYKPGDFYAICDVCGFKHYRSEMRKRWDGALVCNEDYEVRHPQERLKVKPDRIIGRGEKRPEQTDTYVVTQVTQDDL